MSSCERIAEFENLVVVSESKVRIVGDIDVGNATDDDRRARATIKEACPKCKNPELEYYTMQYACVNLTAACCDDL